QSFAVETALTSLTERVTNLETHVHTQLAQMNDRISEVLSLLGRDPLMDMVVQGWKE
ncbi:hypothetical protein KIPB_010320, partial [Kipferlia bialata]